MSLFKTCPTCNQRNLAVLEACEYCGTSLDNSPPFEASALSPPRLSINHRTLFVPRKTELIIGRSDRASGWVPDVDLATQGGTGASGVSRKHAQLLWDGAWLIQDLNSANGTFVNQQRLTPNQIVPLPNGSIIQIGNLYIVFHG